MCTVSWLHRSDGYELFCNRDERHIRKPAGGPAIQKMRGIRFIAPVDGDYGGSWISVNEYGLTLCLLNRYEDGWPVLKANYQSRGLLLTGLMDCRSRSEVYARTSNLDLSAYQPFTLLCLVPGEASLLVYWSGRRLSIDNDGESSMPLISSSYDRTNVMATRRKLLQQRAAQSTGVTSSLLYDFHRSHDPAPGAYSVCMHREDAATVSFSHIKVTEQMIEFSYQPGSPCAGVLPEQVVLQRELSIRC